MTVDVPLVDEEAIVTAWVARRFVDLGFRPEVAFVLAESGADWHEAEDLLAKGCRHKTAAKLLV